MDWIQVIISVFFSYFKVESFDVFKKMDIYCNIFLIFVQFYRVLRFGFCMRQIVIPACYPVKVFMYRYISNFIEINRRENVNRF